MISQIAPVVQRCPSEARGVTALSHIRFHSTHAQSCRLGDANHISALFFLSFPFLPRFFSPNLCFAASLASSTLFLSSANFCAALFGTSSSLTPTPPTLAPRNLIRPSFRYSVITGDAAGRYLNSSLYLSYTSHELCSTQDKTHAGGKSEMWRCGDVVMV